MASPQNDSYSCASGRAIYAGLQGPPAWRQGLTIGQWSAIANTSGGAGAALDAYSGLAQLGTKWVSAASGGHLGTLDNRVTVIDLAANTPAWTQLRAASSVGVSDVPYYSDGTPAARHTYQSTFGVTGNRVLLPGLRYTYGGASTFDTVDAFDLSTNKWVGVVADAPGSSGSGLANCAPSGYYGTAQDGNGDIWSILHTNGNVAKYSVSGNTWSQPAMSNKVANNVRYPWAWDSSRGQLFGLAWGDGEGVGSGVRAVVMTATTQIAISFNASSALTQFQADAPQYGGMDYDPINDRFLWYSNSGTNRVYVITPNAGTTWDMSILSATGSLPATSAPLLKKFAYFPALKGFACMPSASGNIYFLPIG